MQGIAVSGSLDMETLTFQTLLVNSGQVKLAERVGCVVEDMGTLYCHPIHFYLS